MSVPALQNTRDRHNEDSKIHARGPVLDVMNVVIDPLMNRRIPSPSVNLSPAGHARLDLVAKHVPWDFPSEFLNKDGTLWPWAYEAHFAPQDIPKLRQLIK